MTPFGLTEPPALTGAVVDRDDPLRDDVESRRSGWWEARVLLVDERGRAPAVADRPELVWLTGGDLAAEPPGNAVLLGRHDGTAYWAMPHTGHPMPGGSVWRGLRALGLALNETEVGLFTAATGVLYWHRNNRFCGRCGGVNEVLRAGWMSRCRDCGTGEYPRTDPAVICLVHDQDGDDGSRVLLARGPDWPENRMSVLAGFVEPGESLETCVRREVLEEVGLTIAEPRYLGSQPWPLPRSIMIGFAAAADPDQPLRPQAGEIAEARWVTREEVRVALGRPGGSRELTLSPGISISHRMLAAWAAVR